MTQATATTDIDGLNTRLEATGSDGNYHNFSRYMELSAIVPLDLLDVPAGMSLLDVACGSGRFALIAARRGVESNRCRHRHQLHPRSTEPRERRGI